MRKSSAEQSVLAALRQVLGRGELSGVDSGTLLFEDLGLDSTSVIELLMLIETETGAEFDTESLELEHFASVGTLTEFVSSHG
ncbi:acyl carrier protein [Streptomyces sparsogenes]|uniref:Phosphopantetheine-binding protein n=2 Tax=Streptomyces TaxID=1883 RepID=A0ABN3GQZ9_9ACTN|nr:acyl carrier protein [Streptomyces sparsogenes]